MKILIIHTAFIGDIVLSTPLIGKIKDIYPQSELSYLTTPTGAAVLKNNPKIDQLIIYDKKNKDKGLLNLLKLIKKLRKEKYDMVLSLHRYLRSSLIAYGTGAPIRKGYNVAPASFLFTEKIIYDKTKHEVEKLLSFIEGNVEKKYPIEIYPSKDDEKKAKELLGDIGDKKLVVLAPGSRWKTKRWPVEYFNKVIEGLSQEKNLVVVVIGGIEDKNLEIKINENILDLRGKTSLLESAAVIGKSTLLLTNDSSPIHMGSAFSNVRIFAIFGPTVKNFGFTPWSENNKIYEVENLSCRPCGLHGSDSCPKGHFKCMKDIDPEVILGDIKGYINE